MSNLTEEAQTDSDVIVGMHVLIDKLVVRNAILKMRVANLTETLCWISEKDNTYVKDRELILHIARASLNVHCGFDFKISEKYQHLIDELKELGE